MNTLNKLITNKTAFMSLMLLAFSPAAMAAGGSAFDLNDTDVFSLLIGIMIFFIILIMVVADAIKRIVSNKEMWKDTGNKTKILSIALVGGLGLMSSNVMAASTGTSTSSIVMTDDLFWMLVSINIFLFCVLLFLLATLKSLINKLKGADEEEVYVEEAQDIVILGVKLTDNIAIEDEESILMDHEYDGIKELDNNLPPWWVYGFYVTIFFAFIYLIHFHVVAIPGLDKLVLLGPVEKGSQTHQYNLEMKEAQIQKEAYMAMMANSVDESSVELVTEEGRLSKGKELYKTNCVACHGMNGEGGVGPNFADEYWLHGGGIKNVFKTIKYGVPAKGMISWQDQLSPSQIQEVASYILSFQGTNPVNSKEPQGEVWEPEQDIEQQVEGQTSDSTAVKAEIEVSAE